MNITLSSINAKYRQFGFILIVGLIILQAIVSVNTEWENVNLY